MKKLIIFLLAFATSAVAQDIEHQVEYFWQHEAGRLDVVLVPSAWPKDCYGFHVEVTHVDSGKTTKMNRAPMLLTTPSERDMSAFIDDPELAKSIQELGVKTIKESKPMLHSPEKMHSFGPAIQLHLKSVILDEPLMMYYSGLRVSHKLPAGKYKITIGMENAAGEKSELISGTFDTASPPKPSSDPEFSVEARPDGSQTVDSNFKDAYYEKNIPFWLFCGVERGTKRVNTFGKHASMSSIFSEGSIIKEIGSADPDQHIFGIQTTDWFGNKKVYLKKKR